MRGNKLLPHIEQGIDAPPPDRKSNGNDNACDSDYKLFNLFNESLNKNISKFRVYRFVSAFICRILILFLAMLYSLSRDPIAIAFKYR